VGNSAGLGTTGLERTLVISEVDHAVAYEVTSSLSISRKISPQAQGGLFVRAHVAQLDVAIVDDTPEELVLIQIWDVRAEYDYSFGAASRFQRVMLRIGNVKARSPAPHLFTATSDVLLRSQDSICFLSALADAANAHLYMMQLMRRVMFVCVC
jgi:hypothetical protein